MKLQEDKMCQSLSSNKQTTQGLQNGLRCGKLCRELPLPGETLQGSSCVESDVIQGFQNFLKVPAQRKPSTRPESRTI
eukprot:6054508-Amphidinium_carterae.1